MMENTEIVCCFLSSVCKRITNIYNEILDHENSSPMCEICPKNINRFSFIKDQLFLLVKINLQLKEEEEWTTTVHETIIPEQEDDKQCGNFKEEIGKIDEYYAESIDCTLLTENYAFDSDNNTDEEFNDIWDNWEDNQLEIERSKPSNEFPDKNPDCDTTKLYECALCHVKVSQKCNLAQHMIWHLRKERPIRRKDEKFCPKWKRVGKKKCQLCKGIYKEKHECKQLEQKVRTAFSCDFCPESFTTYRKIYNHHKAKHPDKPKPVSPFQCEICGAFATRLHALNRHKMFHTNVYPFECDLCKKKFRTSQKMKEHRETHLPKDERDIKHKCKICGKRFYSTTTLKTHTSLKHKERKTFKCNICGREFLKDLSLKKHLPIHDGEAARRHKCDTCGMIFKSRRYMRQHRKRKHELTD